MGNPSLSPAPCSRRTARPSDSPPILHRRLRDTHHCPPRHYFPFYCFHRSPRLSEALVYVYILGVDSPLVAARKCRSSFSSISTLHDRVSCSVQCPTSLNNEFFPHQMLFSQYPKRHGRTRLSASAQQPNLQTISL